MNITFLGGAGEVGKSAYLLESDQGKERVLLDYGIKVETNGAAIPVQGTLDAMILSHAHLDHSGAIPVLYKEDEMPCFMTPPSLPLCDLLLKDSMKVNKLRGNPPLHSMAHFKKMMRNVRPVPYNRKTNAGGFDFEFKDAGHILGSASVHMNFDGKRVAYTGDIKMGQTQLHEGADWPKQDIDVLLIESTYGNENHPPRQELEKEFVEACTEVCEKGGNALVPSFAVGRSTELLSIFKAHNFQFPVYLDGMCKTATDIMLDFPKYVRDSKQLFSAVSKTQWVHNRGKRRAALEHPSAIVSSAGMCQGGPVMHYMMEMREKKNSAIFITGYQVENCPGRRLLKTKRFQYEDFDLDFSNFRVEKYDFSAHAGMSGLHEIVKRSNPKLVVVVHGDPEKSDVLAKWVYKETGCTALVPKNAEKINVEKYL
jgi:putative mRNA 3-end processing factor